MIHNDHELQTMLSRIAWFQNQLALLRREEQSITNYHASASGFLAEIERMQLEVRDYFLVHPRELEATAS